MIINGRRTAIAIYLFNILMGEVPCTFLSAWHLDLVGCVRMEIQKTEAGEVTIVALKGDLDGQTATAVQDQLLPLYPPPV